MVGYIMSSKDAPNVQRAKIAVLVVLTITIFLFVLIARGIFTSREILAGFLLIPLYIGGAWLGKKISELGRCLRHRRFYRYFWWHNLQPKSCFLTGVSTLLL